MTKIFGLTIPYAVKIRKKWGKDGINSTKSQYGNSIFGRDIFGAESTFNFGALFGVAVLGFDNYGASSQIQTDLFAGIYQQRKCREGKITIREKFYVPTQTWSQAKENAQVKFAAAIAAYQILTEAQKLVYHKRAVGMHLSGYNLFIKEYMLS